MAAVVVDLDGRLVAANDRCRALVGWGPAETGRHLRSLVLVPRGSEDPVVGLLEGGTDETARSVLDLCATDGRTVRCQVVARPLHEAGERIGGSAVVTPAPASELPYKRLVQHASELIVVSDDEGAVQYVSPAMQRILGFEPSEVVGWDPLDFVHPDDVEDIVAAMAATLGLPGDTGPVTCRARRRDGSWRWLEIVVTNLLDDPAVGGIVLTARDITDRKELTVELERQALHDPLTGLPNRLLLQDRLAHTREQLERHPDSTGAVLMLDLDHFKRINDTYGHEAGDRVLNAAAKRLRGVVRPQDTVARLGGDEFVVLCQHVDEDEAAAVVSRIADAFGEPFHLDGRPLLVHPSIGTAILHVGDDPREVLRQADLAMYRAKGRGGRPPE